MALTDTLPADAAVSVAPGVAPEAGLSFAHLADLSLPFALPATGGLDDAALLAAQQTVAEIRRRADATAAALAAEIQHRSRPELGHSGLAQKLGARTAERLVQQLTGSTSREASTLVRVGGLMLAPTDMPELPDPRPWLREVATAVAAGALSLEAADAIRAGLGAPDDEITAEALEAAAATLLGEARTLTVERLAARARDLRLELDLDRVAEREEYLRSKRYLHLYPQADGMTRLSGLLDPESAAIVTASFDAVTSPRRGGPRFVDPELAAREQQVVTDTRTTEQIALDDFVELIRIGTAADAKVVLGAKRPAIKLLVTEADLSARHGVGFIEGQTERVSIATVERYSCTTGVIPILFNNNGDVINHGHEQRLYGGAQKLDLAARDGGCTFGDCDRPPSWCEAHHIDHWVRDHGKTNLDRGLLLCRHHHMLIHNNGWEIRRANGVTEFIPPPDVDPHQSPIPARAKSPALTRLLAASR